MLNFDYILVCGDLHGDLDIIPDFIKNNNLKNCAVIVAGDFGIGFNDVLKEYKRMDYLNGRLEKYNSTVFVIRGNHDDPNYFNGQLNLNKNHVKFVDDYTVLNINGWNILCVGGAVSVDRTFRKKYISGEGRDYWANEIFIYDENKIDDLDNIDFVVTHTSPDFTYPFTKDGIDYWLKRDEKLKYDVDLERSNATKLYNRLVENKHKIMAWYYGHFHMNRTLEHQNTIFTCLDVNEIKELIPYGKDLI